MAAALPNDFSAVSARCPPESSRPFLGKILMVNGNSTTVTSRGRPVQVVQNYIVHRRLSHVFRALEQRQERQRTGGRSNAKRAGNATDAPDHALGHMPVGNPEQAAFTTVDAHLDNQQFAPPSRLQSSQVWHQVDHAPDGALLSKKRVRRNEATTE